MKKLLSMILCLCLVLTLLPSAVAQGGSLENFSPTREYTSGLFTDVPEYEWYYSSVVQGYEYGLVNGKSDTEFKPDDNVKLSETIALAVRIYCTYYGYEPVQQGQGNEWYVPYVEYAREQGILAVEVEDYSRYATRGEYAMILSAALPDQALPIINDMQDGAIPDVGMDEEYSAAVYRLYRAGILNGNDAQGTFYPETNIQRKEVSAIVCRMTDESVRKVKTLLDGKSAVSGSSVLYSVPNAYIRKSLQSKMLLLGDDLLVYRSAPMSGTYGLELAVLSGQTGVTVHTAQLPGAGMGDVRICGSNVAVCDWESGEITMFDSSLQVVKTWSLGSGWNTFFISEDGSKAYCFSNTRGLTVKNLLDGSETVLLGDAVNLYSSTRCGNSVTLSYTDPVTQMQVSAAVDMASGEIVVTPGDNSYYSVQYTNGIWLAGIYGQEGRLFGKEQDLSIIALPQPGSIFNLLDDPDRVLISKYSAEGTAMSLYSVDGTFMSSCFLPISYGHFSGDPVWNDAWGGYVFAVTDQTGKDNLLFWDLSVPVQGENLKLTAYDDAGEQPGGEAVSQSLYDRAAALSEKYGVNIKIADQCATAYIGYSVKQLLDEDYITFALDTLDTVLSSYPEGFIEQLRYGATRTIEINIMGRITDTNIPDGEISGFTSFVAFVQEQEGKFIMTLNATQSGSLEQTCYHEFSHIIERKLAFDAGLREDALFSEEAWAELNPEDFEYPMTYYKLPDHIYTDGYEAWFVDIYSRTYPGEDRARIMENAMMGNTWIFSSSPGRLEKLEYYSRCIRDAFNTQGWPEVTAWEQTLLDCGGTLN